MEELKRGTKVLVQFNAKIDRWAARKHDAVSDYYVTLPGGGNAVVPAKHITVVAPPDPEYWPPRPGDTWEARGNLWLAVTAYNGIFSLTLHAADGSFRYDDDLDAFKALSPVLRFRPESDPQTPARGEGHEE